MYEPTECLRPFERPRRERLSVRVPASQNARFAIIRVLFFNDSFCHLSFPVWFSCFQISRDRFEAFYR